MFSFIQAQSATVHKSFSPKPKYPNCPPFSTAKASIDVGMDGGGKWWEFLPV